MSCREFEHSLDLFFESRGDGRDRIGAVSGAASSAGSAGSETRELLERHAAGCPACAELLALARLPLEETDGVTAEVLIRTSGPACRQAEEGLNGFLSGLLLPGEDRELLAEHLGHCSSCSALASELESLTVDLPRLAIVLPDADLVDDVLRRTLPVAVQLRRWWASTSPQWVRRPRFAAELSYAATLVLVVIFGTPVSPLQAMPERALEFVRAEPLKQFERLPSRARGEVTSKIQATIAGGTRHARRLVTDTRVRVGTISQEIASWFEIAEDTPSAQDQTKQETP